MFYNVLTKTSPSARYREDDSRTYGKDLEIHRKYQKCKNMVNNIKMKIQTKLFKKLKKNRIIKWLRYEENDRDNEEIDEIKTNVRWFIKN